LFTNEITLLLALSGKNIVTLDRKAVFENTKQMNTCLSKILLFLDEINPIHKDLESSLYANLYMASSWSLEGNNNAEILKLSKVIILKVEEKIFSFLKYERIFRFSFKCIGNTHQINLIKHNPIFENLGILFETIPYVLFPYLNSYLYSDKRWKNSLAIFITIKMLPKPALFCQNYNFNTNNDSVLFCY